MLDWSMRQTEHPVAIRVPAAEVSSREGFVAADYGELNRSEVVRRGSGVAVVALGSFFGLGEEVAELLKERTGIEAGIDEALLSELTADHRLVVTLEDGVLDGGFGEKIARFYGTSEMKVLNCGARKEFADRFDPEEFLRENRLTPGQIVEDVVTVMN